MTPQFSDVDPSCYFGISKDRGHDNILQFFLRLFSFEFNAECWWGAPSDLKMASAMGSPLWFHTKEATGSWLGNNMDESPRAYLQMISIRSILLVWSRLRIQNHQDTSSIHFGNTPKSLNYASIDSVPFGLLASNFCALQVKVLGAFGALPCALKQRLWSFCHILSSCNKYRFPLTSTAR